MNAGNLIEKIYSDRNYDGNFGRKYIMSAFRFYARMGKPTYEYARQSLYDSAIEKSQNDLLGIRGGISKPTEQAAINADRTLDAMAGSLNDILAVEQTLLILSGKSNGREIIKAIEYVYFTDADKRLERGDVSLRVVNASLLIPAHERTVHKYLRIACDIFAQERGLRF